MQSFELIAFASTERMSEYKATIKWQRTSPDFPKGNYSREHTWTFDGGVIVPASASPSVVPAPFSNPAHVDPEEAFVAAISSCHMLTFLYLASKQGFQIDSYEDESVGVLTKNEKGVPWVSSRSRRNCSCHKPVIRGRHALAQYLAHGKNQSLMLRLKLIDKALEPSFGILWRGVRRFTGWLHRYPRSSKGL